MIFPFYFIPTKSRWVVSSNGPVVSLILNIIFLWKFIISNLDEMGDAVSLKRAEKIVGQEICFIFADCTNERDLEKVFQKVCLYFLKNVNENIIY